MEFFDMHGIDSDVPINLEHVRTLHEGYLTGTEKGCHTISCIFVNGGSMTYRYKTKGERDKAMDRVVRLHSSGYQS